MHPPSGNSSPPYLSEFSTTADMYSALTQLVQWTWDQVAIMKNDALTSSMSAMLDPSLPDLSLLRAVSVWQNYRTLKFIRGVRISWDYIQREFPPGHLQRDRLIASLLVATAQTINCAFKTPTDLSAARQAQDQSLHNYIQQILKQGLPQDGDNDSSTEPDYGS